MKLLKILIIVMLLGVLLINACSNEMMRTKTINNVEDSNVKNNTENAKMVVKELPKDSKICTREYNPQCGVDGVTYSNPCMAGEMEIAYEGECFDKTLSLSQNCERMSGTWLEDFQECEFISIDNCDKLGGDFQECGSACRHDESAVICTMQCIPFCKIN